LILINFHKTLVITQQKHELDFFEMMKSPWTTSDFGFFFTVLIILNPAVGQDFLPGAEPCEKSRLPRVGSQGSAAAAGAAARGSPGMLWPSDVWNRYIYIYDISDISLKIDGLHGYILRFSWLRNIGDQWDKLDKMFSNRWVTAKKWMVK
jgi:hypothetical protein